MTRSEIAHQRLANQHLTRPKLARPEEVVARLGAVQAQDYAGAKWGLAQRMPHALDAEIERAFTEGAILRTHILRPTWHFITPADIRWMLELTAPRVNTVCGTYYRKLGLDDGVFRQSTAALTKALQGGQQLIRSELREVLERAGVDTKLPYRFDFIIMRAELDGVLCSGARRGKQFTYALLEERVPQVPAVTRDEALHELTKRYFTTRGPATPRDFSWWSGLTIAAAKRGLDMVGSDLEQATVDGQTYWFHASQPSRRRTSTTTHLLPNYDEYFIGFKDRSAIGEKLKAAHVTVSSDALAAHIVFIDGQIVGGWKRTLTSKSVVVHLNLLMPLTEDEQRSIAVAAEKYAAFLGLPLGLQWPSAKRL
jgi:hypothetical protein